MFPVSDFPELIAEIPLYAAALALMLSAIMALVISDRRVTLILLLTQYGAVALLSYQYLFMPLVLVRLFTGIVVCVLLYLSAQRAQRVLSGRESAEVTSVGMNLAFRLVLATLSVLLALGFWQQSPFYGVLQGYGFALLVMMICALMMILSSPDPLRRGVGLLMVMHGAWAIYLYLEQSFLAIVLLDALDVLIALAIAHLADAWLRGLEGSES